ncbi:hypothetical protein [Mesorhizobium huakuii]|uniref:Uncharacterized protein n=1 Tax=Mesorhizobium huakuii TaxID=28104 RepID=A0A7G6SZB3_9HYPH|nr:hypothetical protein [Mesorhizobium huakuii]QND59845.1 hypothetical protein HB778_27275 [Mesorhizobium huakuii]
MKTAVTPVERPVFDMANSNSIKTDFRVPTAIPTGKEAARAELARLTAGAVITYCKYRKPRGPQKFKPRKIAANDNTPHGIPLLEELRRDGREADITWVIRYRLLYQVVGVSPFDDEIGLGEEGIKSYG